MKALYKLKRMPSKLSEAFLAAVKDADNLYNSDDRPYAPQSRVWHAPFATPVKGVQYCEVCLAGALMAKAGVEPMKDAAPYFGGDDRENPFYFNPRDRDRLLAINNVQQGDFHRAVKLWHGRPIDEFIARQLEERDQSSREPIEWTGMDQWEAAKSKLLFRGTMLKALGL